MLIALLGAAWLSFAAPAAATVGRARADAIAIHILHPARSRGATVLFGLPSPLAKGASVIEAAPGVTAPARTLRHRTWLFWEDEDYQALFVHPSQLLLIDAQTGHVVRRGKLGSFPLVNGRRPAFLASAAAYHSRRYQVFAARLPSIHGGAVGHQALLGPSPRAHTAAQPPLAIGPGELQHDCLIMIGDREEPILSGSFAAMLQWARDLKLAVYPEQATNVATLTTTVALAKSKGCDDIFLFISGHGMPPPGWRDPQTRPSPASVNLDSGAAQRSGPGHWTVSKDLLTPADLTGLIGANPDVDFKVKIESCFSGRFFDELKPYPPNLLDLEVSSPKNRVSYGQILVDQFDSQGRLVRHNVAVNDNPFQAGEFTNGDYHGLERWARSPTEVSKTDGDLSQGIADSLALGLPFNAAAGSLLPSAETAVPLLFQKPVSFSSRVRLSAHELSGGFAVEGHTHGRFDTVQVDAPAGDSITSFDAHGHMCVLIDDQGTGYTNPQNGITLPPGRSIVSVRCDRKPVDDEIRIDVTLTSGSARGKFVHVTIVRNGQIVVSTGVAVHV